MNNVKEWEGVDRALFEREILPANRPAVMRGLVGNWPAAGRQSTAETVAYFKGFDNGSAINAMVGPSHIRGRFFYSEDYQAFNFGSERVTLGVALDKLLAIADEPEPPAIALQALHAPDILPKFVADNGMPLLDDEVSPRVWISNPSIVAPHFDNNYNIACVAAGRRRFTVFPPDQVANLYVGPLLRTPGGAPISTVDIRQPDFDLHPRYRDALEVAEEAVLEPGDAIFIPVLWWHGVESLEPLNILVNYWWNDTAMRHKPILALVHCMTLMSGLPAEQRDVWRTFFEHFAFQADGDPAAHLPSKLSDVMGDLSDADRDQLIAYLRERMGG